jgi:hypothetical protein
MSKKIRTTTKTAQPRRRTPSRESLADRKAFPLSPMERMLLVLYSSVPVAVRAAVGSHLFHAWTHPSPDDRQANDVQFRAAVVRFQTSALTVDVFDDIQAGEPIDKAAQ